MQKQDVINTLMSEYRNTPITRQGLEALYVRAESRGYMPIIIYMGLKTLICKNYDRRNYIPPANDPMLEVIHERAYMDDLEFNTVAIGSGTR